MITNYNKKFAGDKNNPGVLFLHGFMGRGSDWDEIITSLSSDFYCLSIDLPGHGNHKEISEEISIELIAEKLSENVQNWFATPPSIIGYSMGGRIAMSCALINPNIFDSLIVESSNPGIDDKQDRKQRLFLDTERARKMESQGLNKWLIEWYNAPLFASLQQHPNKLTSLILDREKNNLRLMQKMIVSLSPGKQSTLWNKIQNLDIPSLLIGGAKDLKYTKILTDLHARIPHSILQICENAGHNVHLEAPKFFIQTIRNFLNREIS